MKKFLRPILTLITGVFISNSVNSKELKVNQRVESIRKALSREHSKKENNELLTYYKTLKEENDDNEINNTKGEQDYSMNWRNNPNWNKNWSNFWNQVSWRNWNKY